LFKIYVVSCDVVFAYGATGAGKTYTMLGTIDSPGITFSAVMALFCQIDDNKNDRVYDVSVSYLEVYYFIVSMMYLGTLFRI